MKACVCVFPEGNASDRGTVSVFNHKCTIRARLWKYAACRHARHLYHLQVCHATVRSTRVCLQPAMQDKCIACREVLGSESAQEPCHIAGLQPSLCRPDLWIYMKRFDMVATDTYLLDHMTAREMYRPRIACDGYMCRQRSRVAMLPFPYRAPHSHDGGRTDVTRRLAGHLHQA